MSGLLYRVRRGAWLVNPLGHVVKSTSLSDGFHDARPIILIAKNPVNHQIIVRGYKSDPTKVNREEAIRTRSQTNAVKPVEAKAPIKFTKSAANVNYRATRSFHSDDDDLPKSHNLVLAASGMVGFAYLIFLRDDIDNDGGKNLIKSVHETAPDIAIPLLQATIAENKRQGLNTSKLEKKLAEMLKDPRQQELRRPKLIEN